ncbi:MAG: pitrilysin family protein [Kiritimatiellae bacterium]|jgi:predicted Zn-dependent peptidase|nr:pitrilysin family protein [Kiritimatiellia bacterium]
MNADIKSTILPNGVRVLTAEMQHFETVAMGLWARSGSRYESRAQAGINHYIEHLLFKGTKRRSSKKISEDIEGGGGYLNGFTHQEATCYYAKVPAPILNKSFDVLADMYLNSLFKNADVESERKVIIEELMMDLDQPQSLAHQLMDDCLWMDHPVGRPIIGNLKTLEKITTQNIVDYQKKTYTGKNTIITFAGKINHEQSLKLANKYFSQLDKGKKASFRKAPVDSEINPVGLLDKDINQGYISIGFKAFGKFDERRFALNVLTSILGGNMSSRLFQTVREKHGLAYYVHSGGQLLKDCGTVIVSAGIQTEQRLKALELIARELLKIKTREVTNSELKRAKDYITGQFLISKESTSNFMLWLGEAAVAGREEIKPKESLAKIEAVTKEDILGVANSVFCPMNSSVAIVANGIDDSDLKQIVDKFGNIL